MNLYKRIDFETLTILGCWKTHQQKNKKNESII